MTELFGKELNFNIPKEDFFEYNIDNEELIALVTSDPKRSADVYTKLKSQNEQHKQSFKQSLMDEINTETK